MSDDKITQSQIRNNAFVCSALPSLTARMVDIAKISDEANGLDGRIRDPEFDLMTQVLRYQFMDQKSRHNPSEEQIAKSEIRARSYLEAVIGDYEHLKNSSDTDDLLVLLPDYDNAVAFLLQSARYLNEDGFKINGGNNTKLLDIVDLWAKNFNIWNEDHKDTLLGKFKRATTSGDLKNIRPTFPLQHTEHARRLVAKNAIWDAYSDDNNICEVENPIIDAMGYTLGNFSRKDMVDIRKEAMHEGLFFRSLVDIYNGLKDRFGFDFEYTQESSKDPRVQKAISDIGQLDGSNITNNKRMIENFKECTRVHTFAHLGDKIVDPEESRILRYATPRFYGFYDKQARKDIMKHFQPPTEFAFANEGCIYQPRAISEGYRLVQSSIEDMEEIATYSRRQRSEVSFDPKLPKGKRTELIIGLLDRGYVGKINVPNKTIDIIQK